MQLLSRSIFTSLFISVTLSTQVQAANLTARERVNLVVDWFTGFFDNSEQVARDLDIPFLTMENCATAPTSNIPATSSQYVYLEQYINGNSLLRSRGYEFSPTAEAVDLKVYRYSDQNAALGTCQEASPNIDLSTLVSPSCDVSLTYEPKRFFGTNAPIGCPASVPNLDIVSMIEITPDEINSLDQFISFGVTIAGTTIEFRRVATTNEPLGAIALIGLGITGAVKSRFKV